MKRMLTVLAVVISAAVSSNAFAGTETPNLTYTPLPEGYQELEWIESTGKQYIDTQYVPKNYDVVSLKAKLSQDNITFFSARGGGKSHYTLLALTGYGMRADKAGATVTAQNKYFDTMRDYSIVADFDTLTVTVNDETWLQPSDFPSGANGRYALANNLCLFALHNNNSELNSVASTTPSRLYSFRLMDGDTRETKMNLVPCRELSTQTVGVYDVIRKRFIGPTKNPSLSTLEPLKDGPVVSSAHPVELLQYIQTDGKEYVDTGFRPLNTDCVFLRMAALNLNQGCFVSARTGSSDRFELMIPSAGGKIRMDKATGYTTSENALTDNDVHCFAADYNASSLMVDGGTWVSGLPSPAEAQQANPMWLFRLQGGNYTTYASVRFFGGAVVDKSGKVKLGFAPCRDTVTGECGLYDAVNGGFMWFNGIPTAGPKSYERYQELKYVQTTGNQYIETGLVPDNSDIVSLKVELTQQNIQYFDARGGGASYYGLFGLADGKLRIDRCGAQATSENAIYTGAPYEIVADFAHNKVRVGGDEWISTITGGVIFDHPMESSLIIFGCHQNSNTPNLLGGTSPSRLYSFNLTGKDGTAKLDLIPCRDALTAIDGLYDRVGQRFYMPSRGLTQTGFRFLLAGADVTDVTMPFSMTADVDAGSADLSFGASTVARKLRWVYGNSDQGVDLSSWDHVTEVQDVAADVTSLSGVALPTGLGADYRVIRAMLGNLLVSDPLFAEVPFAVTKVYKTAGKVTKADLVFTGAPCDRSLYVAYGRDAGTDFDAWANKTKVCDVTAGITELAVDIPSDLSAAMKNSHGYRFFLVGEDGSDASQFTVSNMGLFIVVQ